MAKKKVRPKGSLSRTVADDPEKLARQVAQYEEVFGEVERYIDLIASQEREIIELTTAMHEAKAVYEESKRLVSEAREARDGTKHGLFMFLKPGPAEIMPLFDRMEPADEELHGHNSSEWRKEPISALRLSLIAANSLTNADILLVGQLQDRILDQPDNWYEAIEGLTRPMAMAIADRLTDFINEQVSQ
jgi:hypothetical protein